MSEISKLGRTVLVHLLKFGQVDDDGKWHGGEVQLEDISFFISTKIPHNCPLS